MKLILFIACAILAYMFYTKNEEVKSLQTGLAAAQSQLVTAQAQVTALTPRQQTSVQRVVPSAQPAPAPTMHMNYGGLNSSGNSDLDRPHPAR